MKPLTFLVLCVIFTSALSYGGLAGLAHASQTASYSIQLSVVPPQLPTGGLSYPAIVVSLITASGQPYVTLNPVLVYLSSSDVSVGQPQPEVVVEPGHFFAVANFTTTTVPGTVSVTASSQGAISVSIQVQTVEPVGYPSKLAVYASPAQRPAGSSTTGNIVVELEDQSGLPAKAVSDTVVTLSSSSVPTVNLTSNRITIPSGSVMAVTTYRSGEFPGKALVTASSPNILSASATVSVQGPSPIALNLLAEPSPLPAHSTGYLSVWLSDASGHPATSPVPIYVTVTSSNQSVASVQQTIVIPAGHTSASAVITTGNEGEATLTALSKSLTSAEASVSVRPTKSPEMLGLSFAPSPLAADNSTSDSVIVSLYNDGSPAITTSPVTVYLASSNTSIGQVEPSVVINGGSSYAVAWFKTTYAEGTTSITASAQNMVSSIAQLSTYAPTPAEISISMTPALLPADAGSYRALLISLLTAQGQPAVAPVPIPVQLFSSNTNVTTLNSSVVIPVGSSSVLTWVDTSSTAGTAVITALASNYGYASTQITTIIPGPTKLAVYTAPSSSLTGSLGGVYVAVQVQDSSGNPAQVRFPSEISMFSTGTPVLSKPLEFTLAQAGDSVWVTLYSNTTGQSTLSVTSTGLEPAYANTVFSQNPLEYTITLSSVLAQPGQAVGATFSVSLNGVGIPGVNVSWTATDATVSSSSDSTNSNGVAYATIVPSKLGSASVTATGSIHILGEFNATAYLAVSPPTHKESLASKITKFPFVIALLGAPAGAIGGLVIVIRRRSAESEHDEGEVGFG